MESVCREKSTCLNEQAMVLAYKMVPGMESLSRRKKGRRKRNQGVEELDAGTTEKGCGELLWNLIIVNFIPKVIFVNYHNMAAGLS